MITTELIPSILIEKTLGYNGRMISGSKSGYCRTYPENVAIFNANLVTKHEGRYVKVWHGDLDLTKDAEKLLKLSELSEKSFYVLREMAARFENEETPDMRDWVAFYDASQPQNLQVEIGPVWESFYIKDLNVIKSVKP
jgi:hypothetical protein